MYIYILYNSSLIYGTVNVSSLQIYSWTTLFNGHEQVELALVLHQWGNDFFAMPDILDGLVVPYGSSRTFLGSVTGV